MTIASVSDAAFLALLERNLSESQIAREIGRSERNVRYRTLRLSAQRAGAAVAVTREIVQRGLDHAAGHLMAGMVILDQIEDLAAEAEEYHETRDRMAEAIIQIADESAEDQLYTPDFHRLLERATDISDPRPQLLKAVEVYHKNVQLYADIYDKMVNIRLVAQLKDALLSLLDIDNPDVRTQIAEKLYAIEATRGLLGIDRYHTEPDASRWTADDEKVFQLLPHPATLPDSPGKDTRS